MELTELTRPHMEVLRYAQLRGLEVERETPFPPYKVDIYVPRYHAAVEVDGPHHDADKDAGRDDELWELYQLAVHRIASADVGRPEEWWPPLAMTLNNMLPSARHRREYSEQMAVEGGV